MKIERNCLSCQHLSSDDDGSDYPSYSWPVCDRFENYSNLKSFPFKKEMKCFVLSYWCDPVEMAKLEKEMEALETRT